VHVLWFCRCDYVYFSLELVVVPLVLVLKDEDMVLLNVGFLWVIASNLSRLAFTVLIPLTFSRLTQRWP
jgi:hypothetical protein